MKTYRRGPETDRLILREMTVDDASDVFAFNSNADVMRFTGEPPFESLDQARERITNYPDFETVGYGRWGCELKGDGRLIGFCGLKYLDDLDEVDLGYRFLPEFWGRGLATEACRASVRFGFEVLELERIIALIIPENVASIRVVEKVGMRPDGTLTYHGDHALKFRIDAERS